MWIRKWRIYLCICISTVQSVVQILEMVHKLLPHVAAVNQLAPSADEAASGATTTGHYYTWVESDHPYKQATVTNLRSVRTFCLFTNRYYLSISLLSIS